jgi:hypothetical protein
MVRLVEARVVADFVVSLRFSDGVAGRVDLRCALNGPVFASLKDPEEFRKLSLDLELGTITWPNGADLAPEFLYAAAKRAAA